MTILHKSIIAFISLTLIVCVLGVQMFKKLPDNSSKPITIGILMPMEHAALRDIIKGFEESLLKHYSARPIQFDIQNAQGDIKLQRAILEKFVGNSVDIIVPIGTMATQMALKVVERQPIVSLAALITEADRQSLSHQNMTGVLDEIGGKKKLDFLKQLSPNLKKIAVIYHTGNEKNAPEIEEIGTYGKSLNISIQKIGVQTLPELQAARDSVAEDVEALLIIKDHLIASGIRLLVPLADSRSIPLIASDEGSVREGATLALGVREQTIGEVGGQLSAKILQGASLPGLPIQSIEALTVFYNPTACSRLGVNMGGLEKITHSNGYQMKETGV